MKEADRQRPQAVDKKVVAVGKQPFWAASMARSHRERDVTSLMRPIPIPTSRSAGEAYTLRTEASCDEQNIAHYIHTAAKITVHQNASTVRVKFVEKAFRTVSIVLTT